VSVAYRQVRATYTEDAITVYQAYSSAIAKEALQLGRFGRAFSRTRMTWIKPSFRWMMYRCGFATKPGQEHVLAVEISRTGFEWAVRHAGLSHHDPIAGIAHYVSDSADSHRFRIEITEVVLTKVGTPVDHLLIESRHPGRGVRRIERR
jgi:hypothetical protein